VLERRDKLRDGVASLLDPRAAAGPACGTARCAAQPACGTSMCSSAGQSMISCAGCGVSSRHCFRSFSSVPVAKATRPRCTGRPRNRTAARHIALARMQNRNRWTSRPSYGRLFFRRTARQAQATQQNVCYTRAIPGHVAPMRGLHCVPLFQVVLCERNLACATVPVHRSQHPYQGGCHGGHATRL
jgi:hypothetical protein